MIPTTRRMTLAVAATLCVQPPAHSAKLTYAATTPPNPDAHPMDPGNTPAPELRHMGQDGLAIRYAADVFIDQHQQPFEILLARVRIDKLDTYRNLSVWREYDITWTTIADAGRDGITGRASKSQTNNSHTRHVARYEHAQLSDLLVHPDGYASTFDTNPLHATSAHLRPIPDSTGWIIVSGIRPGTIITLTDSMGRTQDHRYTHQPDGANTPALTGRR